MASFTGEDPKDTYLGILNLGHNEDTPPIANTLHPTTLQTVLDAAGILSLLELSQDKVAFTGIMEASVSGMTMEAAVPFTSDSLITDQVLDKTDNSVGVVFTTGDPEGSLVAGIGSLALRKDGSGGATLYIKESGVGDTGWTAVDIIPRFIELTDTPMVYTADKWLKVNEHGNALEFTDPPTVALGAFIELSDVNTGNIPPSYVGKQGRVIQVDSTQTGLEIGEVPVSHFVDLTDAPSELVANKYLQVNSTGNALILVDSALGGSILDLSDTPSTFTDMGTAILAVNEAADGVEFIADGGVWGDLLFFNGAKWTRLPAGTEGQVLTTHQITNDPTWETLDTAVSFLELTDTAAAYPADSAFSFPHVNIAEDGLEFPPPLYEAAMYSPFTPIGIMAFIDADSGTWTSIPAPYPADDPSPRVFLSIQPSEDPNTNPGGPGIVGGTPEWYPIALSLGEITGNDMSGASDYELPYAQNTGGPPEDNEFAYASLAGMLADANFIAETPSDGDIFLNTTADGPRWGAPEAFLSQENTYREPMVVDGELLLDEDGDLILLEVSMGLYPVYNYTV